MFSIEHFFLFLKRLNMRECRAFNMLALDVLDSCYEVDAARIQALIRRPIADFQNKSCLELAADAQNRKFLSHKCCTIVIDDVWNGFVSSETSTFYVLLALFSFLYYLHFSQNCI